MRKQDLYILVESLTPVEKKVFKEKYRSQKQDNFVRLFDAIANGAVNNDSDVKKTFAGENFVKHLHKTKSYLYNALLETLLLPLQGHYGRLQILQQMQFAEVLISRKLLDQAEQVLLHARQLARHFEEGELEFLTSTSLYTIYGVKHCPEKFADEFLQMHYDLEEHIVYNKLYVEALQVYAQRGKKNAPDVADFLKHPLIQGNRVPRNKRSKQSLDAIKGLVHTVRKEYDQALPLNQNVVAFAEGIANDSPVRENNLVNALFNLIVTQQTLKLPYNKTLTRLQRFQPVGRLARAQRFVCLARVKLNGYLRGKKAAEGQALINWALDEMNLHKDLLEELEQVKLNFSIAMLLMKEGDFNKALDHLLIINNSKQARENRTIIYRVTQVMQLICYYELADYDRLMHRLRNYRYYQKTEDAFYLVEKFTLNFLNKAVHEPGKKERAKLKAEFENNLYAAAQNELRSGLAYLQNIDWIKG